MRYDRAETIYMQSNMQIHVCVNFSFCAVTWNFQLMNIKNRLTEAGVTLCEGLALLDNLSCSACIA